MDSFLDVVSVVSSVTKTIRGVSYLTILAMADTQCFALPPNFSGLLFWSIFNVT